MKLTIVGKCIRYLLNLVEGNRCDGILFTVFHKRSYPLWIKMLLRVMYGKQSKRIKEVVYCSGCRLTMFRYW